MAFFTATPKSCKTYFDEGAVRAPLIPEVAEKIEKYGAQFYSACDGLAASSGIPRPGTNAWRIAHPNKSGGRRTRKRKSTRKGRKGSKSRRNRH
uniref:Uncharacterized protein n=1 Tax=viral metagenome TaxID=1070528 RepID=A0A6C0LNJ1_9ZZZZ